MLSLTPRFDLYKFNFDNEFIPEDLRDKYNDVLYRNQGVIMNCLDYLNESIQSLSIPGLNFEINEQTHHETNSIERKNHTQKSALGRINVEPEHKFQYATIQNPLETIDKTFKVTFRMNQGLFNYFLLYEIMLHSVCKPINEQPISCLNIELLNETGTIVSKIKLTNLVFESIDGLDFTFNQVERESKTFDVNFKYNNIDFDFIDV